MLGIGVSEFMVIFVVALLIFGPDKLPDFAKQAGRMVRQVRQLSQSARDDIRSELGPEFADFELTDLDPRRALRKHIAEAWDEPDEDLKPVHEAGKKMLAEGETPPYDVEST